LILGFEVFIRFKQVSGVYEHSSSKKLGTWNGLQKEKMTTFFKTVVMILITFQNFIGTIFINKTW
jgi:hypothetical protein